MRRAVAFCSPMLLVVALSLGCSDDGASKDAGDLLVDQGAPADGPRDRGGDVAVADLPTPDQAVGPLPLRIMAANLTSGSFQSYDPGHGARIMQAFAPDIVLIQELNYGDDTPQDVGAFVEATFGYDFSYYREAGAIPNGVISRYPIVDAGEWDDPLVGNRDFAWARIDIPGPEDLWAISVHFLSSNSSSRYQQASQLIDFIQQHVPAGALLVLGGDFNSDSRTEGCVDKLRERFTIAAPYPADQGGNDNTNAFRNKPYDWVVASAELDAMEVPLLVGQHSFPDGLVFDSRVYQPLAEVPPVQEGDSGADQMQHMAVIRQFSVP